MRSDKIRLRESFLSYSDKVGYLKMQKRALERLNPRVLCANVLFDRNSNRFCAIGALRMHQVTLDAVPLDTPPSKIASILDTYKPPLANELHSTEMRSMVVHKNDCFLGTDEDRWEFIYGFVCRTLNAELKANAAPRR